MTDWGSYSGHLRVGIDVDQSPATPSSGTTSVTLTVRYYVETDGWDFDDDQTLNLSGSISGSVGFHNGLSSGSMLVATRQISVGLDYDSRATRSFGASLSGAYNGASPSKSVGYTAPYRPAAPPSAPGTPARGPSASYTSVPLSWSAPSNTHGAPVDRYQLQVDNSSGFSSPVYNNGSVTGRSATVGGLTPGATYYARVRAHNSAGWSDWSGTRSFTMPADEPSKAATPSVSNITATSASIGFTEPSGNGSPILEMQLAMSYVSSFSWQWTWEYDGGRTVTYSGLTRATDVYVRVRARNAVGWGAWSNTRVFTTDTAAPSPPRSFAVSAIRQTGGTFSWQPPADSGGSTAAGYDLQVSANSAFTNPETIPLSASSTAHLLADGLLPLTTYWARIRAHNLVGPSDWSAPLQFQTAPAMYGGTGSGWGPMQVYAGDGTSWVPCEVLTGNGSSWVN